MILMRPVIERVLPLQEARRACAHMGANAEACSWVIKNRCYLVIPRNGPVKDLRAMSVTSARTATAGRKTIRNDVRTSQSRRINLMYDLILRGGTLYDGSGRPGQRGDLAIADGRIAALGDALGQARREIDVSDLAVAPGFIDIKTHSDFTLPINPKAESKVRQGVTTEIIGHCGFSVAPVLPGKVELLRDYLSPSAPWLPFRERPSRIISTAFRRLP